MTDILWNNDTPISDITSDIEIPPWITQDITPADVAAIVQGGCASGAYMPAVTYHQALATMADHGDTVLQFIEDSLGELPGSPVEVSWRGLACHYLSCAVEIWAGSIEYELTEILEVADEEDEAPEDEEEIEGPDIQDEDYVITDARGPGYVVSSCRFNAAAACFDDALAIIRERCEKEKFFPNTWYVNERGNTDLIDRNTGQSIRSWV